MFGIIIIIIIENPQLVVQLPPQSTTHKTLGVMICTKDVSGKLALHQFQFFLRRKNDRLTRKAWGEHMKQVHPSATIGKTPIFNVELIATSRNDVEVSRSGRNSRQTTNY